MARLWSRKRRGTASPVAPPPDPTDASESVRLDGDDHAWWAQEEVTQVWRPRWRRAPEPKPERDILAEHFGDDWRTSFGFAPSSDGSLAGDDRPDRPTFAEEFGDDWRTNVGAHPSTAEEPADAGPRDPYEVLEVAPTATWDEIIAAHRHQARIHHPDLLFGQSDDEKAESEDRIRTINAAYEELQIRRGV
jgi:DnaJ-domain-containing protein 1